MHSFLVAEWKTILLVFLFCGGIFAWFYAEEIRMETEANAPYPYDCLGAGDHVLNYKLGTALQAYASEMNEFKQTRDDGLGVVRYERPDGGVALNFRDNVLVTIEYYPEKAGADETCKADAEHWKAQAKTVAQSIPVGNRTDIIYDGMILVQEKEVTSEAAQDGEAVIRDIGWIVTSKKSTH